MSAPTSGTFRFNTPYTAYSSQIAISGYTADSANAYPYQQTWDDSTTTNKGYLIVQGNSNNSSIYSIFSISSITSNLTWTLLSITPISGVQPANGQDCVISFSRTGDIGSQGLQGLQGNQGAAGTNGSQGNQGFQGLTGTGNQGSQGFQGNQGLQGIVGTTGNQGNQGFQGVVGTTGSQGFQGLTGTGNQGDQGYQGHQGDQGWQGEQGDQGHQGWQGHQGDQGWQGDQGYQGSQGDQGYQGDQGQGNQGDQGSVGSQGDQGYQGYQGVTGTGNQGNQGLQGLTGPVAGSANQVVYKDSGNAAAGSSSFTFDGTTVKVLDGIAVLIKGTSPQPTNIFTIQNIAGTSLLYVDTNYALHLSRSLNLLPFNTSAGNTSELRFYELAANGTTYVGFKAGDNIANSVIWTLPTTDGTSGQVLSTNASGVLSWITPTSKSSGSDIFLANNFGGL